MTDYCPTCNAPFVSFEYMEVTCQKGHRHPIVQAQRSVDSGSRFEFVVELVGER